MKINNKDKNIVLIGFMGSGKTSVGKRLSLVLKREFIDTDDFIEKREGMTINEIFKEKGEEEPEIIGDDEEDETEEGKW